MIAVIDVDGVLVDMHSKMLHIYNHENNSNLTINDITQWDLSRELVEVFKRDGFFSDLPLIEGAEHFLLEVNRICELVIATSPSHTPHIAMDKLTWLNNTLPAFKNNFCITSNKNLFNAHILLDDYHENTNTFHGTLPLLMNQPWNIDCNITPKTKRVASLSDAMTHIKNYVYHGLLA